jgi:hypothetical protein
MACCSASFRRWHGWTYRYGLLNIAHAWLRLAHGAEIVNLDWDEPKESGSKRARPKFSGDSAASVPRPHLSGQTHISSASGIKLLTRWSRSRSGRH